MKVIIKDSRNNHKLRLLEVRDFEYEFYKSKSTNGDRLRFIMDSQMRDYGYNGTMTIAEVEKIFTEMISIFENNQTLIISTDGDMINSLSFEYNKPNIDIGLGTYGNGVNLSDWI